MAGSTAFLMRAAAPADLDTVVGVTQAAYRPWTARLGRPPVPVTEDYAPRIAGGNVHLLEAEGAVRGLIVLERGPDHLLVFSVAVLPDFQGRGAARFMFSWAEQEARAAGLPVIRLCTNARMERNIALYQSLGFVETGRRANPARPGWILVDMARPVFANAPSQPSSGGVLS